MRTGLTWTSGARIPGLDQIFTSPYAPTPWQLNWWTRMGWIDMGGAGEPVPPDTIRQVLEMTRLIGAGFTARRASELTRLGTVRRGAKRVIPAGPGVTIIVEPPARVDT